MLSTPNAQLSLVVTTPLEAARTIADEIARLLDDKRRAGRGAVLGLATGKTPLAVYAELVRRVQAGLLRLDDVTTFNLDEYLGLEPEHPRSFRRYMREHLFGPAGLRSERTWIPDSGVSPAHCSASCAHYERAIAQFGGIDLQLLGIGRNGHIGFNEPGSARDSRTRVVELAPTTREDAAAQFGALERVPRQAISMGIATILQARRIRVMAFGANKRAIVRATLEGAVGPEVPATFLRGHPDVQLFVDAEALGA